MWSEIPVYQLPDGGPRQAQSCAHAGRSQRAQRRTSTPTATTRRSLAWSVGNELASEPGRPRRSYLRARRRARASRSTRRGPSRWPSPATRAAGCQRAYAPHRAARHQRLLRLVPGPAAARSPTATQLSGYLDRSARCYPNKAIVVTEFGAEANRDGPAEEKGTYAVPGGLRPLPPRRVRAEAVAHGRDLLGAAGVPRAPGLGRRQPAARRRRCTRRGWCGSTGRRSRPYASSAGTRTQYAPARQRSASKRHGAR